MRSSSSSSREPRAGESRRGNQSGTVVSRRPGSYAILPGLQIVGETAYCRGERACLAINLMNLPTVLTGAWDCFFCAPRPVLRAAFQSASHLLEVD